jgi:hypothetical protein
VSVKNPTRGARSKAAEAAAASEAIADGRLPTRQQLVSTVATITANLAADMTDPLNPRSSSAAKRRKIDELNEQLERGEYRRTRGA